MNVLRAMEFGVKTYITHGPIVGLSKFDGNNKIGELISLITMITLIIVLIILGIKAVDNLCPSKSNIRMVLYILLLISGGRLALFYILLSLLNVKFCS